MRDGLFDLCAHELRSGCGAFTRGNLLHAARRKVEGTIDDRALERQLEARMAAGALEGLLPPSGPWRGRRLSREWDAYSPAGILLVDRRAILDLFVASGVIAQARLAVVCLDGAPAGIISWLKRGFRRERQTPIAYLHDARTVVYPFAFEPLASLVRSCRGPVPFRDLGLPPLGRLARDFAGASVLADELVFELEALPPAALVSHATHELLRMVPGDPNMMPLAGPRSPAKKELRR